MPTPDGDIELNITQTEIQIFGAGGTGTLKFKSKTTPICKEGTVVNKGNGIYELTVENDKSYTVNYKL